MAVTPSNALTPAEKRAQRDAAEQDVLLREVDEAVRQGDFEDFVAKWGKPLLAIVIGLLAIFAGYLYWQSRQEAALEKDSEAIIGAIDQLQAGNVPAGYEKLGEVATSAGPGAATAAKMIRAGISQQQGRTDEAVKIFAEIAKDDAAPAEMRDLAKIREIALRYDSMPRADVIAALKPLAVPGKPFFPSAGEMLAHAYLDAGKKAEAGALFAEVAKDKDAPDPLRTRARQMAGLLGVDAIEDVDTVIKQAGDTLPAAQ